MLNDWERGDICLCCVVEGGVKGGEDVGDYGAKHYGLVVGGVLFFRFGHFRKSQQSELCKSMYVGR